MSDELPTRAVERLLEVGAPLRDRPELAGLDHDRYDVGRELGRGGMGVVYEAWDRELERHVALKVLTHPGDLSSGARQRFVREAKAAARLQHPHIATVYDATPSVIAMQRIAGETLDRSPIEDPRDLAALVRDAALAIHFAHGEGIIHRDLKPGNLMVVSGERPHVYVMDFGLAKERTVDSSISISGHVLGTPGFMAPEQAAGRLEDIGPATDVYGLGATMYACLAGHAPFEGEDLYSVLQEVIEAEPTPLARLVPTIDRDLAIIVGKCLAKEPGQRYASALTLAGDLDRWLRQEPIEARPPSMVYRTRRFLSRRQGIIAAAIGAALLVLVSVVPFAIHASIRRADAEQQRALTDRVLTLSERVHTALRDAREKRSSGVGHERGAFQILEAAIDDCRSFLDSEDVGHVWYLQGRLLREQGRFDESIEALDQAETRLFDPARIHLDRGLAHAAIFRDGLPQGGHVSPQQASHRQMAHRDLQAGLATPPDVPTAEWIFAEGQLAWMRDDVHAAIERLREAIEMDSGHQGAHLSLSRLYLLLDRDDLAARHSVIATDLLRGRGVTAGTRPALGFAPGATIRPDRELVSIEGMRELLIDFDLLLQLEPGDINTYGKRGQVELRHAMRSWERGSLQDATASFELAINEFTGTIVLQPDHAMAYTNRGVCRTQQAKLLSASGKTTAAANALRAAQEDYQTAIDLSPMLAVAWYNRALLHVQRAELARMGMAGSQARIELEEARADAVEAIARAGADHPWAHRFARIAGAEE